MIFSPLNAATWGDMAKDKELIAQFQKIKQSNLKEIINKYLIVFSDKVSSVSY